MAIQVVIQDLRTGIEQDVTEQCLDAGCYDSDDELITSENLSRKNVGYLMDVALAIGEDRFGHDDVDAGAKGTDANGVAV